MISMTKKLIWMAVFMFFTMVVAGLCLSARQQQKSKSGSATQVKASAGVPSVMAVRMHVHDIGPQGDHADDNDHCITFDPKPSPGPGPKPTPSPLKVEIDLSDDPGQDLNMDISMFYVYQAELASEQLHSICKYDNQHPKTCMAEFGEDSVISRMPRHSGGSHPAWHLGDQPDGTYLSDGSLSTTMEARKSSAGPPRLANSKKVPGLPDPNFLYAFRNPSNSCGP